MVWPYDILTSLANSIEQAMQPVIEWLGLRKPTPSETIQSQPPSQEIPTPPKETIQSQPPSPKQEETKTQSQSSSQYQPPKMIMITPLEEKPVAFATANSLLLKRCQKIKACRLKERF